MILWDRLSKAKQKELAALQLREFGVKLKVPKEKKVVEIESVEEIGELIRQAPTWQG